MLKCEEISLAYFDGDRTTLALSDVTVDIPERGFIGVMGPSGSGKSSLLYVLSGLKRPTSGNVVFRDRLLSSCNSRELAAIRRESFGFVFQQPWLLSWQTAAENAMMGAPNPDRAAVRRMLDSFDWLGLATMRDKMPSQISGGEKQRVCVARAMINEPSVIFADEPTASLDHRNGHMVIDLLSRYRDRGAIVVVTHDAEMVQDADRVLIMRDGRTVDWVTPSEARHGSLYAVGANVSK